MSSKYNKFIDALSWYQTTLAGNDPSAEDHLYIMMEDIFKETKLKELENELRATRSSCEAEIEKLKSHDHEYYDGDCSWTVTDGIIYHKSE